MNKDEGFKGFYELALFLSFLYSLCNNIHNKKSKFPNLCKTHK